MPILGGLMLIIQVAFAIHAVRSGRETYWLYIIMFLPGIGAAIYFFTQVLPEMQGSYTVRKAENRLLKAIDPARELRRCKEELEISDTIENRIRLADECIEANFHAEAIDLLQQCQRSGHANDPDILLKLAEAQFGAEQYTQAVSTLDHLIQTNPDFRSPDGHLLYARSLEGAGRIQEAMDEYAAVVASFPGEEARLRYGELLQKQNQPERARALFEEILKRTKRSPKYYQRKEKPWIKLAEKHLKEQPKST